jgi:D-psicose/D-tagatose/L-ribulose 3-epimerase
MKIGFCMLLWTTHVTEAHRGIIEDLKKTGYDGIEVPIFEGTPDHYERLGRRLDEAGLERTSVGVIPSLDKNPISDDPAARKAAVDYLAWSLECSEALGSRLICGPIHSTLGHFTGVGPTDAEKARAVEFHRAVGEMATKRGIAMAVEAVNRFECYLMNTLADLGAHLDAVDHPAIGALYDTFHANIEEQDPVGAFDSVRRHVNHVHITENDRGVPGRGHVPWRETFAAIKRSGYDGWLTVEAFGRALPELAAATRVWRDFAESPEAIYRGGFRHIRDGWEAA